MKFEMNPAFEKEMAAKVVAATQEAVDVTSRAHHEQGEVDVEGRLSRELQSRGINPSSGEWLAEMAETIRGGAAVIVHDESEIGADVDVDPTADCDHDWELVEVNVSSKGSDTVNRCTKCEALRYDPSQAALRDERPPL